MVVVPRDQYISAARTSPVRGGSSRRRAVLSLICSPLTRSEKSVVTDNRFVRVPSACPWKRRTTSSTASRSETEARGTRTGKKITNRRRLFRRAYRIWRGRPGGFWRVPPISVECKERQCLTMAQSRGEHGFRFAHAFGTRMCPYIHQVARYARVRSRMPADLARGTLYTPSNLIFPTRLFMQIYVRASLVAKSGARRGEQKQRCAHDESAESAESADAAG